MSEVAPNAMGFYPIEAVEWRVGPVEGLRGPHGLREVRIAAMTQRDGRTLYAVREGPWCANKASQWEIEPLPTTRRADFIRRCRWTDFEDAALIAQRMVRLMLEGKWPEAS
jgi:hypothetical protein